MASGAFRNHLVLTEEEGGVCLEVHSVHPTATSTCLMALLDTQWPGTWVCYFPPLEQQVKYKLTLQVSLWYISLKPPPLHTPSYECFVLFLTGEICAFKIHGQEMPFEAVVLNKTSGEGRLRARSPIDCELQKEYTFIIQAYDCGSGPGGTNWKKSHKWVKMRRNIFALAYICSILYVIVR